MHYVRLCIMLLSFLCIMCYFIHEVLRYFYIMYYVTLVLRIMLKKCCLNSQYLALNHVKKKNHVKSIGDNNKK